MIPVSFDIKNVSKTILNLCKVLQVFANFREILAIEVEIIIFDM